MVINCINGKIGIPKDIINLVVNIKFLLTNFFVNTLEFCNRIINREVDATSVVPHIRKVFANIILQVTFSYSMAFFQNSVSIINTCFKKILENNNYYFMPKNVF